MIDEEMVEREILANVTKEWRKVAFVVGTTMLNVADQYRVKLNDSFFHLRIVSLAERGIVEYKGDLSQMRVCEIREGKELPKSTPSLHEINTELSQA